MNRVSYFKTRFKIFKYNLSYIFINYKTWEEFLSINLQYLPKMMNEWILINGPCSVQIVNKHYVHQPLNLKSAVTVEEVNLEVPLKSIIRKKSWNYYFLRCLYLCIMILQIQTKSISQVLNRKNNTIQLQTNRNTYKCILKEVIIKESKTTIKKYRFVSAY